MNECLKNIYFRTDEQMLKKMAYTDCVYAWLLLHSHYIDGERHNYIYKNEFTFKQIAADLHRHRDTISKRFKDLLKNEIIFESEYNRKKVYKMTHVNEFEKLHGLTVLRLITLPIKEQREELIKTYAYLLKRKRESIKREEKGFYTSANDIILAFGHSNGNSQMFDNVRFNLTVLQGAGIIEFEITPFYQRADGTIDPSQMFVYKVNDKASNKWLGIKDD